MRCRLIAALLLLFCAGGLFAQSNVLVTSATGSSSSATTVATTSTSTNASFYPLFVASTTNGNQAASLNAGLLFNPSTDTLTTTTFVGALTGNSSTASAWATARNLAGNSVDGSGNVAFANKFIVQGTTDSGLSQAQFLGALGTGILKNATTTGILSIAVAGDFPTLNQNTTGSAATLTTPRAINGVNFDGSAPITITAAGSTLSDTVTVAKGGTGNTSATDDNILIGNGTGYDLKAIANCTDSGGNHLNYTAATNAISCGTSASSSGITNSAGANVIPKSDGTNIVASALSDDGTNVKSTEAILPSTAAGKDLGSATLPWKDAWLAGSSGTPGTNNFRLTGTATAARVVTLPDLASYTLAQITNGQTFAGTNVFSTITITTLQSSDASVTDITYNARRHIFSVNGSAQLGISNSDGFLRARSNTGFGWTSTSDPQATIDTSISRAAAKVMQVGDGGNNGLGWVTYGGTSRVKTSDVTNATATMAAITGLTSTLIAGRFYSGEMVIKCINSTATEGIQFDFNGGTATMTSFIAGGGILASGGTDVVGNNISTALGTAITFTTFTGESFVTIKFSMKVNAAGTFIPRFAENTTAVGTATVRVDSYMILTDTQ